MVLKAVVKALKKADKLKEKIIINKDLLTDNETWLTQQQLQRIYQQVLILDLEYALDKKIEQELWNHGFKNFIANLQNSAKDKKNPKHSEAQAMLCWCLEAASGFYLTLLHEICAAYDLDLPFRRKGSVYGCNKNVSSIDVHCQPNKSSCYYICQHCLVHLGDIARYRNQSRQAEAFYRYAVQLSPSSGQPYNQLAILEASRGDKLSTVYHYVRSVALRHPFPVASTNLSRTLNKHAEEVIKLESHTKLSCTEYVTAFLKLHGLLHSNTELETAEKLVQVLTTSLTAHIATESLTSWKLVQIVTINIFALHNARGTVDGNIKTFGENELTDDEQKIETLITDFLAACLTAFLLPVYTIKSGESLIDYFAMPAIKLTLEWIQQEPEVLEKSSFKSRLQIWPSLCKMLNDIQPAINNFPAKNYAHVPLPEDRDLQGFLPFEKSFQNLKFHTEDLKINTEALNKLRGSRLINFGLWLSEQTRLNIITCTKKPESSDEKNSFFFEAVGSLEPLSGEQIKELEEMILTKLPSPTSSETSGLVTGASTPDSTSFISSVLMNPLAKFKSSDFSSQENLLYLFHTAEKRPGILKCQKDSSDKTGEKGCKNASITTRGHRNVALQAIINKNTEEVKQGNVKNEEQKSNLKTDENVKKEKKTNQISNRDWNSFKGSSKDGGFVESATNNKTETNSFHQKSGDVANSKGGGKKGNKGEGENKKKDKSKDNPFPEFMTAFPPLPNVKDGSKNSNNRLPEGFKESEKLDEKVFEDKNNQKNVSKQQLLSELFSKNKTSSDTEQKQPQNMSGLLNLNKQQQKMLTDSKVVKTNVVHPNPQLSTQYQQQQQQQQSQQPQQPQQQQQQQMQKNFNSSPEFSNLQTNAGMQKLKCVDKMEIARKEYEVAMFALQQKQNQDSQRLFSDMNRFDYDSRMNMQPPPPPLQPQIQQQTQPQLYVRVNQPMINVGNFGFKYPTQFYLPWQEPQEPPLPPSWWSETPQTHQQSQPIDLNDVTPYQEGFPYNDKPSFEFDWSFQPFPNSFPIYVPPPVLETTYEDFHSYQISDNFSSGMQVNSRDSSLYANHPQGNSNMQPMGGAGNNSYSLFSTSSWGTIRTGENDPEQNYGLSGGMMAQQSFWSGPGPSPLERLLEQQKQMRKEVPDPKNGT
ncbi:smg-7, putative [Pediculus humanus corporis]|uniref:Smg-7, putative n=1 Tax=Pediculus humanus subsp. corporis TaxID=121224 RepID=E0VHM3_PEDHC|nr:smg-7, putative [Pediculus humanus corporis]EEB12909.1 smg-7, putative [Pediculus humanus corporis]